MLPGSRNGWVFGILGPLRLHAPDGTAVEANRRMQRVLLGMLLLRPNLPISTDVLIDALWPGRPPPSAVANLQSHMSQLRRLLAVVAPDAQPRPRRTNGAYVLPVGDGELDATVFGRLAAEGRAALAAGDPATAEDRLTRAAGLWRGGVLEGLDMPVGFDGVVAELEEVRLAAAEDLADARIALGRYREVVADLRALVGRHPLRERSWSRLLLALHRSGDRAAALVMYEQACGTLQRELGVGPGDELRGTYTRIAGDPADGPAVPRQLPFDVGDFTGREVELGDLHAAADDPQRSALVVVTGIGGIGKTALAVRWAHEAASRFPDGQLFVDLRGFSSDPPLRPFDALAQLLGSLGVPGDRIPLTEGEAAAMYRSLLADRRTLVILDNAGDVAQVRPLLPGSGVTVVTSRERLNGLVAREGAQRVDLDALDPDDAEQLLRSVLGRARTGHSRAALGELARLCGYIPLALRITATNLLDDRYRDLAAYLRTMRAGDRLASLEVVGDPHTAVGVAFDLSYDRLGADERRLFRTLGVVPVLDVTPHAAAATVGADLGDVRRQLNRLAEAQLLRRCGADRFTFHDLLRLHARARAEDEDPPADRVAAVQRLLDWYLGRLREVRRLNYPQAPRIPGARTPAVTVGPVLCDAEEAIAWCESERHNILMAVREAAGAGVPDMSWLLTDAVRGYLFGTWRGADMLSAAGSGLAAAEAGGHTAAAAAMQLTMSSAYMCVGRLDLAIDRIEASVDLARRAGWTAGVAVGLSNLGAMHGEAGRLRTAVRYYERSIEVQERTGDHRLLGATTQNLGHSYAFLGRIGEAARYFERAVALDRASGSTLSVGEGLANLGFAYRLLGRYPEAVACLDDAIEISAHLGGRRAEILAYFGLADVHRDLGAYPEALAAVRAGLARCVEHGYTHGQAIGGNLETSILVRLRPDPHAAGRQAAWADAVARAGDRQNQVIVLIDLVSTLLATGEPERALDTATTAVTIAHDREFRLLEAQALTARAAATLALGRPEEALTLCRDALALHRRAAHPLGVADTLTIVGDAESAAGRHAAAREAWEQARAGYEAIGSAHARTPAGRLAREVVGPATCGRRPRRR